MFQTIVNESKNETEFLRRAEAYNATVAPKLKLKDSAIVRAWVVARVPQYICSACGHGHGMAEAKISLAGAFCTWCSDTAAPMKFRWNSETRRLLKNLRAMRARREQARDSMFQNLIANS